MDGSWSLRKNNTYTQFLPIQGNLETYIKYFSSNFREDDD